jgi:hypothetical protein
MARRYEEAKLAVTMPGMVLLKTSLIIGFATLIRPIPPVQSIAAKQRIYLDNISRTLNTTTK